MKKGSTIKKIKGEDNVVARKKLNGKGKERRKVKREKERASS